MNIAKISLLSLVIVMTTSFATACNKTTKIEREVEIGPGGSVSQKTTVDKEVKTGIKDGEVEVETKVDLR